MALGNHIEETRKTPESYPMNGGDSPYNYAQNSCYQKGVIEAAKDIIMEAITHKLEIKNSSSSFDSNNSNTFRFADFGCSTGPNTFIAMQNILQAVEMKYKSINQTLEFHVFFNDHVDNDFNTLFRTLPQSRPYFAAGVPGSFYDRLFPKATLHVVHSSYALQWLSKVPKQLGERNSPAWNKGKTYCTSTNREVSKVYFDQFKKDLNAFLNSRAHELVEGGLMVIQLPGVPNGVLPSQTGAGMLQEILGSCLIDMANMGSLSEETVDSLNMPLYFPSPQEMELLIGKNNYFKVEKMDLLMSNHPNDSFDPKMSSLQFRAVMEGIIKEHFGSEIMEQLFQVFTKKLEENRLIFEKELRKDADLFVLLKRKSFSDL